MTGLLSAFLDIRYEPWRDDAACQGVDAAVFDALTSQDTALALRHCRGCPVVSECLEWVTKERGYVGVAGGRVWGKIRKEKGEADRWRGARL